MNLILWLGYPKFSIFFFRPLSALIPWNLLREKTILKKGSDKYRLADCVSALLTLFGNLLVSDILTDV